MSTSNGSVPDGSHMSTFQVAFLHLPTVDRQAPSQRQVGEGVAWILDKAQSGKGTVYVHCKAGRARSATLVAAYLIEVVASITKGSHPLKKMVFFGENLKGGGGGLAESKISVNRKKLRIFWIFCQKGGGLTQSKISVNRKNEIFGHILPKRGDFVRKTQNFSELGRGGLC